MMTHRRLLCNPKYGAVGFVSYFYFLIYELFSPVIELLGCLVVLLACLVNLVNTSFMILFFTTYAVFGSILSLTIFFARTHTIDLTVSFSDVIKAVLLCFFEITILRFGLAVVRAVALLGYRKKKHSWGSIKRQRINLK